MRRITHFELANGSFEKADVIVTILPAGGSFFSFGPFSPDLFSPLSRWFYSSILVLDIATNWWKIEVLRLIVVMLRIPIGLGLHVKRASKSPPRSLFSTAPKSSRHAFHRSVYRWVSVPVVVLVLGQIGR